MLVEGTGTASLSIGACVQLACTLEATAPKLGNVFPGREFSDLSVVDFLAAASASGHVFERASAFSVGQLVLNSVMASRRLTQSNANLGIVLLLAPTAKAAIESGNVLNVSQLREAISGQLKSLTHADGRDVFRAIRMASAGGLGEVDQLDVHRTQEVDLISAMGEARGRDAIAEQYCTDFAYVFREVVPCLQRAIESCGSVLRGITDAQIELLSRREDTLIERKCGQLVAQEARTLASDLAQQPDHRFGSEAWQRYDQWFRADGNRRNPGTTADMIAAGLFVLLITGPAEKILIHE